jgi:hypothetical protein
MAHADADAHHNNCVDYSYPLMIDETYSIIVQLGWSADIMPFDSMPQQRSTEHGSPDSATHTLGCKITPSYRPQQQQDGK